jgi:hypothetical protein
MADFTVRSDHIDVEQIMRQIRARIRDKRGADYTEAEIRELANVKLDKFLDPKAVRSDLLLHYRQQRRPADEAPMPLYAFDPSIVYTSDRGTPGRILTFIRKLLNPILKLFFNPTPLLHVVHLQSQINERMNKALVTREEFDALNFEMFNNLVVELTRVGIEVRNLRMQVESFGTRLDFDERRARALEGAVQYKPGAPVARPQPPQPQSPPPSPGSPQTTAAAAVEDGAAGGDDDEAGDGESGRARRRRRRRGRRRGQGGADAAPGSEGAESDGPGPGASAEGSGSSQAQEQPRAQDQPRGQQHPRVRETPPVPYVVDREPAPASQDVIGTSAYDAPHEEPAAQPIVRDEPVWREPAPVEPVSIEPVSAAPVSYEPVVYEPAVDAPAAYEPPVPVHEAIVHEPVAPPVQEQAAPEPSAEPEPPAREWHRVTSDPISASAASEVSSPWPLADPEPEPTPPGAHWPEAEPPAEVTAHHDAPTPPPAATDESPAPDSIVPRADEPDEPSRS